MTKLADDDLTRYERGLALLRAHRSPPAHARAQVLGALEQRLAMGPGGGESAPEAAGHGLEPLPAGSTSGSVPLGYAAKVVAATLGLTAAGVLALRVVGLGLTALGSTEPPAADEVLARALPPAEEQTERERHPSELEPDPQRAGSEPDPQPGDSAANTAPSNAPSPQPEHAQAATASPAPQGETPSVRMDELDEAQDMTAELALIQAARAAQTPAAAITALEAHAARFPAGVLSDERELLWVLADCDRGALEAAKARAERFVSQRASSPLIQRIASGCPAIEIDVTNLDAAGHG